MKNHSSKWPDALIAGARALDSHHFDKRTARRDPVTASHATAAPKDREAEDGDYHDEYSDAEPGVPHDRAT